MGRAPSSLELSSEVARLTRNATTACAGFDVTFTPVKSVSALWAVAPQAMAAQIEEAHNAAGRLEDLLLTALEDPVENASFILCTPQPRVFGEALLTRLSRIHLRPPPRTELLALMHRIAANENWPVLSDELLTYCCDIHQDLPRAAVGQVWHCVLSGITTPQELAADLG